jgi:23S rRNA pseudouridine1911/1915/1917 synthase
MDPYLLNDSEVMFLDNHLLVVNKPPGLLVQVDKDGNPCLEQAAKAFLKVKFDKPGNVFATATHRLDRPVGGLVVLARTSKSLVRMNHLFQNKGIRKVYLAVVEGKPKQFAFLRHWIKKNEVVNKVWTYTYPRGDAKQADLAYFHLASEGDRHLVMVRLFTGRHHQIRAQLAMDGIPICGDVKYGSGKNLGNSVCLYSYGLEFEHPVSHQLTRIAGVFPSEGLWKAFSPPDAAILDQAMGLVCPEGTGVLS